MLKFKESDIEQIEETRVFKYEFAFNYAKATYGLMEVVWLG